MNQNEPGGSSRLSCGLLCDGGNMEITLCATQSRLATRAAVRCALDAGLESIAIPGMGTGTGGLAPREAAAAVLWGIRDALYPPVFPASLADVLSF